MDDDIESVALAGATIRLGQFLKFANMAESGAQARELIAGGDVRVDGEVVTQRGRQLSAGALVEVAFPGTTIKARVA